LANVNVRIRRELDHLDLDVSLALKCEGSAIDDYLMVLRVADRELQLRPFASQEIGLLQ